MKILTWIAFACWGVAIIVVGLAFEQGNAFALAGAISLAITGVLFSAADRALSLLTDIRNAVAPRAVPEDRMPPLDAASEDAAREAAWQRIEGEETNERV